MHSIPYTLLVDLADGRLESAEATKLRARVAADAGARAELAALERLIALMRSDDSVDPPEYVIDRALRLMRRPQAQLEGGLLRRLVAALESDSWQTPELALGLRSVQAWPRALLLSAGDRAIDLQIAPCADRWQLQGQVFGPDELGMATLAGAGERVSALLSELSEFTLPPVAGGRYTLTVTHGDCEIVVPDLEVGPSASQR